MKNYFVIIPILILFGCDSRNVKTIYVDKSEIDSFIMWDTEGNIIEGSESKEFKKLIQNAESLTKDSQQYQILDFNTKGASNLSTVAIEGRMQNIDPNSIYELTLGMRLKIFKR